MDWLSDVSGEKDVSDGASSRDGQAAQATASQQLQQDDPVETFRQSYLSSGKLHFKSFLRCLCFSSFRKAKKS